MRSLKRASFETDLKGDCMQTSHQELPHQQAFAQVMDRSCRRDATTWHYRATHSTLRTYGSNPGRFCMRVSRTLISATLVLLVLGCVNSGEIPSSPPSPGALTRANLMGTGMADLYDAIERLRPRWLKERGSTFGGSNRFARVFLNGFSYGDLDFLRQIQVLDVSDVSFLSAADAATRFGTPAGTGGVILVRTH